MNICIVGSGSFGTAIGSVLANNPNNQVLLISRNAKQSNQINTSNYNSDYLDDIKLSNKLSATTDFDRLKEADLVLLAIPSRAIYGFLSEHAHKIKSSSIVGNLAKGYVSETQTLITEHIVKILGNNANVASIKGPTFAQDLLRSPASGLTIAAQQHQSRDCLTSLFHESGISVDIASSLQELEYLSILKNVYAIVLGVVEAKFSNPNLRSVVFTNCLAEMKLVADYCCGHSTNIFLYAGVGDLLLTGLNDHSRNRTLGLMIGKGFIKPGDKIQGVVTEGLNSISFISNKLLSVNQDAPCILHGIDKLMKGEVELRSFVHSTFHQ